MYLNLAAIATAVTLTAWVASALDAAPLVLLPVGTRIHNDEGGRRVIWTVVESKPNVFSAMREDGKGSFSSTGGVVSPALRYTDERGDQGTQRVIEGDPLAIYPVQIGRSVRFRVAGEVVRQRRITWTNDYTCSVTGTERIKVALGEFDTFVVQCERFAQNQTKEQTVTRYYAPIVGLTVRSITIDYVNNNQWNTDTAKIERP